MLVGRDLRTEQMIQCKRTIGETETGRRVILTWNLITELVSTRAQRVGNLASTRFYLLIYILFAYQVL